MTILLYISASMVLLFIEKKMHTKHFLSAMVLVIGLAILMGANETIADTQIYMKRYAESVNWSVTDAQWAMSLFMHMCNLVGLTYIQFRILFFVCGLLLIWFAVSQVEKNIYLFFVVYFIYTMIIDSAQIKNFMAMAFVTVAITYLANPSLKNSVKYVLFILLAAGFQITAYAYLPLVVFCNAAIKRKYRALACLPVLVFAIVFSNRWTSRYLANVLLTTLKGELLERSGRFIANSVNNGYLVYFLATIVIIYITAKLKKQIEKNEYSSEWEKSFANVVYLCSIYSLMFIPLYFYAQDFSRLLRNFTIVNHMLFFLSIRCGKRGERTGKRYVVKKTALVNGLYIAYLIYMFYWDIAVYMETVVEPFFTGNFYL